MRNSGDNEHDFINSVVKPLLLVKSRVATWRTMQAHINLFPPCFSTLQVGDGNTPPLCPPQQPRVLHACCLPAHISADCWEQFSHWMASISFWTQEMYFGKRSKWCEQPEQFAPGKQVWEQDFSHAGNCWCYSTSCALRTASTQGLTGALGYVLGVPPCTLVRDMQSLCTEMCKTSTHGATLQPPPCCSRAMWIWCQHPFLPLHPAHLHKSQSSGWHTGPHQAAVVSLSTSLQWPRPGDGTWPPWACVHPAHAGGKVPPASLIQHGWKTRAREGNTV